MRTILDSLLLKRSELLKYLPPSSCVTSTLFAVEYLRVNDIEAHPQPVHLVIDNHHEITVLGRKPGASPPHWNGHLVAMVGEYLLDMTLDQAGLVPSYFPIQDGFPASYIQNTSNLIYFEDPRADATPDFMDLDVTIKKIFAKVFKEAL